MKSRLFSAFLPAFRKSLILSAFSLAAFAAIAMHLARVIAQQTSASKTAIASAPRGSRNPTQQDFGGLSATAQNQIMVLIREKGLRTLAQKKLDIGILDTIKMRRGEVIAPGVATLQTGVTVDASGRILADIDADVSESLIKQIESAGGQVLSNFPKYDTLRARIPATQIEKLAELNEIRMISRAAQARTHGRPAADRLVNPPSTPRQRQREPFTTRAELLRKQLPALLASLPRADKKTSRRFSPLTGSVTSQGDVTHNAAAARSAFGTDGSGVKIGVLSDSVNHLAESQASGDLGPVTVLPGQNGAGVCFSPCSEGTAMLEIIHDLAPGAQLYFATAFVSWAGFAQNILDLRAAGCDIIVDDVEYFNESPFQDGIIAQAVNSVTADGALYFSSAGNSGNLNDGTSGVWEGDFVNGGTVMIDGHAAIAHSFGATIFNTSPTSQSGSSATQLFWSDPLGASSNDYDLYILDETGTTVLRRSDNYQTGTQNPYEILDFCGIEGGRFPPCHCLGCETHSP